MSEHFSRKELCHSEFAVRHGLLNVPDEETFERLESLASEVLEQLRAALGLPIYINSGFRTKLVNKMVGGSPQSQHMKGEAADIVCPGISVSELYNRIKQMVKKQELAVDQVILEFNSWVHLSYSGEHNRCQFLIASKENGRTKYRFDS